MTPFAQQAGLCTAGRAWLSGSSSAVKADTKRGGNQDWHLQVKMGQDWCPESDLFCKRCSQKILPAAQADHMAVPCMST